MSYQLDAVDRKILSYLVSNARMPYLEIARECNISGAAVHQRVKKLENSGINLSEDNKYPEVVDALKHVPEIVECHFVTGKAALFLKVFCFDNEHLMNILINTIQRIPYVLSTDTMISLDQAFEREVWVKDYKSTSFKAVTVKE